MLYYEELKIAILDEDLYAIEEVVEKIKGQIDSFVYIRVMLELIEENPSLDFGSPGPLVHFMEEYYNRGYETELLMSIRRKPTNHTVWMVNRILNDKAFAYREKFINELMTQFKREDISYDVKSQIKNTLDLQNLT